MQVDDIDRYGASHVVVTGITEKKDQQNYINIQIPFHIC